MPGTDRSSNREADEDWFVLRVPSPVPGSQVCQDLWITVFLGRLLGLCKFLSCGAKVSFRCFHFVFTHLSVTFAAESLHSSNEFAFG